MTGRHRHRQCPCVHTHTYTHITPRTEPTHHPITHTSIEHEAWNDFASLEKGVGESERARAIFELAIAQPALDMPEVSCYVYGTDRHMYVCG